MQNFYKKSLKVMTALLFIDMCSAALCLHQSQLSARLTPMRSSSPAWVARANTDVSEGGASSVRIVEGESKLVYDLRISDQRQFPFASVSMLFVDADGAPRYADLSRYSVLTFKAKCLPGNWLKLSVSTFKPGISIKDQPATYPKPETHFTCSLKGNEVDIDLTRLVVPQWWLSSMKLDLTEQEYKLDMVDNIAFSNSWHSPHNVDSHVEISEISLKGCDWRYLHGLLTYLVLSTVGFIAWFFSRRSKAMIDQIKSQMKNDLPLVAYRQLSLEPHKEKEKSAVLRFIATNYTDPGLDLDTVVAQTGANRNKVNDYLKSELGLTFSAYLNKLRLTEAARLLLEPDGVTIAEIAYSVGYSNVSYFNKLFKEDYDCTPKVFRTLAPSAATTATEE